MHRKRSPPDASMFAHRRSTVTTDSDSYSMAAGQRAKAYGKGSFVWADSQPFDFVNAVGFPNVFAVGATGGATFTTNIDGAGNPTRGVAILPGAGGFAMMTLDGTGALFAHGL